MSEVGPQLSVEFRPSGALGSSFGSPERGWNRGEGLHGFDLARIHPGRVLRASKQL